MSKKLISFKKFYFKLLLDFKYYFLIMQVCMLSWSLQESLSPYFIKRIVDILDSNKLNKQTILSDNSSFFITSALTYLTIEIGYRLYEFIGSKFYPILRMHVRIHTLEHIIGHSHEFFTHNYSGSISNIISRFTESIQDISEKIICIFVPVSISLIITTILLFNASLYLGIGLIIWFVIYFFVLINFANKSQKLAEIHSQQVSGLNGLINDIISNIFTVRIFSKSKFEISKLKNDNQTEISASLNSSLYNFKINTILAFVTSIFIIYMIFGGISLWQKNLITTSELVLSISSLYIVGLVWYMGFNLIPFYTQIGICKEGLELINTNHEIIDSVKTKLQINSGKIEFKNVSFDYKNNNNILENCNIIINANQKIGLVGLSGSGKTTFANLIIRLFDTSKGSILIDNIDIQHISQDNLRSQISYIPQDTTLFHRTILENIKYGNNDATLNEVITAAKLSKAHDFIINLKDGYHTIVGEKGSKLSGGQRQRIAITRAILKNSKIIIMDEATSALDLLTEHEIQQNIYKNITDKTLIVIAHRLNTLKEMDRILVFKKGSIIEDGTHSELIGKKGYYFELWNKGNNSN